MSDKIIEELKNKFPQIYSISDFENWLRQKLREKDKEISLAFKNGAIMAFRKSTHIVWDRFYDTDRVGLTWAEHHDNIKSDILKKIKELDGYL